MARSSSNIPDVIYKDLHQDISTGKYDAGDLLPSENDLAKKYKATRFYARKALDLLEKRGFVVNKRGAGRTVTRQSANQIKRLAIMDSHSFEYYMNHPDKLPGHVFNWQSGIYEACGSLGVTPIYLTDQTKCLNDLLALLQQVLDSNVDAIICHPGFRPGKGFATFLNALKNCGVPVMCFHELTPQDQIDYFHQDNYAVGQMLTEHAISRGHERIGFMGARIHDENKYYRYRGYVDVMQQHGLQINDVHTVMVKEDPTVNFWQPRGKEAIVTLAERGVLDSLTSIICYNDQMAEGAIEELKVRGYSVPDDISIIAFDNDPRCLNYELTTGFFPYAENAAEATKKFIKRINDNSDSYVNMSIKPQLVERKSVKDIS